MNQSLLSAKRFDSLSESTLKRSALDGAAHSHETRAKQGGKFLHRTLKAYARCYNEVRTHRSSGKDTPETRPAQFIGLVLSRPVLGGLHHHYVRV
jgi:hypothetical protein